jgi:hypothetical protein
MGWPPSAAYCRDVSEVSVGVDDGTAFYREMVAPGWAAATGIAASDAAGAPSNAYAGAAAVAAPNINARMARSNVRITLLLVRPAWMGHRAIHRRSDLLRVFPQRA